MRALWTMMAALSLAVLPGCGEADAADTTLRYAVPDNPQDSLVIQAASDGRMRIEDGRGRLVLVRGDETLIVFLPPSGGRAAARLEDYLAVGAEVRERMVAAGAMTEGPDVERYAVRQGEPRTVGAWQGTTWSIDPVEAPGVTQEIVVSTDPALADVQRVAVDGFEAFEQPTRAVLVFPGEYLRLSRETMARGMPISVDGLDLQSVSRDPIPAGRFELNEPLLSRDQLRELVAR
ncbi:hypothetical protein [Sphingosinicella terrae]|uniref:hypothetical protein n=1 Tax=Sphingosinicella terrae TaxID=2172047 RepID=UPI000E0D109C|nr:hypothetical protein [Sphingosinicella terrae]